MSEGSTGVALLIIFLIGILLIIIPLAIILYPPLGIAIAVSAGVTLVFGLILAIAARGSR